MNYKKINFIDFINLHPGDKLYCHTDFEVKRHFCAIAGYSYLIHKGLSASMVSIELDCIGAPDVVDSEPGMAVVKMDFKEINNYFGLPKAKRIRATTKRTSSTH